MKKLFTILLFLSATTFFAQGPVIEGTYYPVRNTSIKQVWDTTQNTLAIPATGPNQVWDYRNSNGQFLNIVDTFSFKFIDPSATPYAQYFPAATHALYIRTPLKGNPSDSLFQYFKVDYNGLHSIGGFNIQHQYDSTINYNPTEFYAPPSMAYLYSKVDTSKYVGYASHYFGYKGKTKGRKIKTFTYVGYGTLKLPNFTYNNVAQIREDAVIVDSVYIDFANNGIYTFAGVTKDTSKVYQFYRNNTFGSAYLLYLNVNRANTKVLNGWYTLPVDFGSISGTVFTNTLETTPITNGEAYLYRENSNFTKNDILAKATVDVNGNYKFDSIPHGEYRIAIRPNATLYPNAMITYFGDTTNWIDATPIITTTTTSTGHKIHIQSHAVPAGTNNIEGQLGLNLSIMRTWNSTFFSNPIPSIGIVVKKNPGSAAARTSVTDSTGKFALGTLDDGSYTIFVDIPGLHMAGTYSFAVSGGNAVNNLDYIVGTDSIHPINASALGIKEVKSSGAEFMSAYPNPYSSNATIVLNLPTASPVLLEVYDILGKKIQTLDNSQKQMGVYKYTFSAKSLNQSSGMYFVKLKAGNATGVLKLIEQ